MDYSDKGDPVTPCMYFYEANIQYDGSIDTLKFRIVVRGYLQNEEIIGDNWDPKASMSNLNYFLEDAAKHKAILHQLDFIGAFLKSNVKHRVFVELDSIYVEYFPEYANYFGIPLRLNK